jgi:hypothetical protein
MPEYQVELSEELDQWLETYANISGQEVNEVMERAVLECLEKMAPELENPEED